MPLSIEGKQFRQEEGAKARQVIGNKFASAFGKIASVVLPSSEQPVLGQSGIPQFDDYQNRAVAEAKSMAEIQEAKQGFQSEEAKRAWIINYLTTRFSEDPEFKNADPAKLPEWALKPEIKDPIAEIKAAKEKKEELKGQAGLMQSAFTKGSVKIPTDEEASADVGKINLMLGGNYTHPLKPNITPKSVVSAPPVVSAPSVESAPASVASATTPTPSAQIAPTTPAAYPITSAYSTPVSAPAPLLPTTASVVGTTSSSEGDHPWLGDGYKNYVAKPMKQAYSQPVKQFSTAEEAFKAAPYATQVSEVKGMGFVPKAVPLNVAEEISQNTRRIKADVAKKGYGTEGDEEDVSDLKPMRVKNPAYSSQYTLPYKTEQRSYSPAS